MKTHIFIVTDANGLWGDMRLKHPTSAGARRVIRATLIKNEVEPNGSLLPKFKLTRTNR